jgi:hypothetical protein
MFGVAEAVSQSKARSRTRAISASASDCDPCLSAEDIIDRGKSLAQWRMGRWSHFPFLFVVPSRGLRLIGSVLFPHSCRCPGGAPDQSHLPQYMHLFILRTVGLSPRHTSCKVTPQRVLQIHPRPYTRTFQC